MWEELKFAVDFRAGDTKPIKKESSRANSKSLLSKSNAESINKYGMIGDEVKGRHAQFVFVVVDLLRERGGGYSTLNHKIKTSCSI